MLLILGGGGGGHFLGESQKKVGCVILGGGGEAHSLVQASQLANQLMAQLDGGMRAFEARDGRVQ